jgi:hypothetical protein
VENVQEAGKEKVRISQPKKVKCSFPASRVTRRTPPAKSPDFHALANPFSRPDRCCAIWRVPVGVGAIADQLSMVRKALWELDGRTNALLFRELSTVWEDNVRHCWGLLSKPVLQPGAA